MANTVTLTFAGDTANVESAFNRVGGAAREMNDRVRESGDGFDHASERFDTMDTRAMGFRDTLTGIQDGTQGIKQAAAGDWGFETLLLLGFGVGDLASGMVNSLIPAFKSMKIATLAAAAATKIAAAAQWLMNTALFASPITWVIIGIIALIVTIGLLARHWKTITKAWNIGWEWVKKAASNTWDFIKKIPGWLASAFGRIGSAISRPFRDGFNAIARAWNATVGRLSWTVPAWVPGIGGNTISVPHLPQFHSGGVIPGVRGEAVPFLGLAGERVSGPASSSSSGEAWVKVDLGDLGDALLEPIRRAVSRRGGSVTALGVKIRGGVVT